MTPFYVAGALLVIAQATGIYGLVSKRADIILSVAMLCMVAAALVAGGYGAYHELH